jgi:hypothetical protein
MRKGENMNTKQITLALMMGALGNVLFLISFYGGPITQGIALDFSLIGVLIAGIYGGPIVGLTAGIVAGVMPGLLFGPMGSGGVLGLIGLPLGKALTGVTIGLLSKGLCLQDKAHASLVSIPAVLASYIPEGIFTYAYFTVFLSFFLNIGWGAAAVVTVMIKAIIEVVIMSIIIAALIGNKGFNDFITAHFTKRNVN